MPTSFNPIIEIAVGVVLLLFGQKFFWVLVGVSGFLSGLELCKDFLPNQSDWMSMTAGIVLGLVGAGLAYFIQHTAMALLGFAAGCYSAFQLLLKFENPFHNQFLNNPINIVAIGGIVGSLIAVIFFREILIFLSSSLGSLLIIEGLSINQDSKPIVFVALTVVGMIFQAIFLKSSNTKKKA